MPLPTPKLLNFAKSGRPILSSREIESFASNLIQSLFPRHHRNGGALPIGELVSLANSEDQLEIAQANLPKGDGWRILGRTSFDKKQILLDECLFTAERVKSFPFVFCHELGHWLLHRHRLLDLEPLADRIKEFEDRDQIEDQFQERKKLRSERDWVEWQANHFAGCLLLPRTSIIRALEEMNSKGIFALSPTKRAYIFENNSGAGRADTLQRLRHLAEKFGVSPTVVRYRLKALDRFHSQPGGTRYDSFDAASDGTDRRESSEPKHI